MKKVILAAILSTGFALAAEANATAPAADANATAPKAEANATAAAPAADAAKGKAVYAKCAGCHGPNGERKALGKSEVIAGWDAAKTEEALKGYKEGKRDAHGMGGTMKGQAASLSDEDIKAVAAYIASLKK